MCFFTLGRYDALWVARIYLCSLSASWLGLSSTPKFYRNVSLYHCDLPNSLARKSREFLALRVTDSLIVPVHCQFRNFLWFGWKEKIHPMAVIGILLLFARSLNPQIFSLLSSILFLINQGQLFFSSPDL